MPEAIKTKAAAYDPNVAQAIAKGLGKGLRLRFAAAKAGVTEDVALTWYSDEDECQIMFDAARADWIAKNLRGITPNSKGDIDARWQASAWAIERTTEEYAQPRAPAVKVDESTGDLIIQNMIPRPPAMPDEDAKPLAQNVSDILDGEKAKEEDGDDA